MNGRAGAAPKKGMSHRLPLPLSSSRGRAPTVCLVRSAAHFLADTSSVSVRLVWCLGENYELKSDLHSESKEKRADAIKRTVASMTVGKDVSGLFPDILVNMVSPACPCMREMGGCVGRRWQLG